MAAFGDVPLLDPVTGRFPDSFAPPSVAQAVTDAQAAAAQASAPTAAQVAAQVADPASATRAALGSSFIVPQGKTTTGPAAPLPFMNIRDFGAIGDGTTDDSPAIQAAVNAAGIGGRTVIPPGVYKCTTTITTPMMSSLEGISSEFGVGGTGRTELKFPAAIGEVTGVALGVNGSLSNIIIRGPGTPVVGPMGITGASVRLTRVSVLNWHTGVRLVNAYYAQMHEVEFNRNKTGLSMTGCYNVSLFGPKFSCESTADATLFGVAIQGGARGLNIFGGSIEHYKTGISLNSKEQLSLYGVYFETGVNAAAKGVLAYGRNNVTVTASGCFVYLNGHDAFVDLTNSTNTALTASGNHFVAVEASVQVPTAYLITSGQDVTLSGDGWGEVAKTGTSYAGSTAGGLGAPGLVIAWPRGAGTAYGGDARATTDGRQRVVYEAAQTVTTDDAVVLDASRSDHSITLQANVTSSSIVNMFNGQELRVTIAQDATGGRTFTWPSVVKFAGGTAPSGGASTRSTVTLRYSSGTNRWYEVSRAAAVPVS